MWLQHLKYISATVLFTLVVCLIWPFAKLTGRENPLKQGEYKEILVEIKQDIYGGK